MKYLALFALLTFVLAACWLDVTEASFCPCDLSQKGQICGSNGVTYKNRCEFECTQRDYKRLNRPLNIAKTGEC